MSVTVPAARAIPGGLEPGSPEWLKRMSASKVAAAIGLSPYDSPFSLWHKMAGLVPPEPQTNAMSRGHYLEPALRAWFADQHPELVIHPGGCWENVDRPWQTAAPDGLLSTSCGCAFSHWPDCDDTGCACCDKCPTLSPAAALLECKSDATGEGWGTPGTDQIPVGYKAQGYTQMDVTGVRRVHFAMIGPFLEFAEYVLEWDEAEALFIRERAKAFLDSLPGGPAEQRPDIDAHTATYQAVRAVNLDIEPVDVEVGVVGKAYIDALLAAKKAEERKQRACSDLADLMGNARRALYAGERIAYRRAGRPGHPPYLTQASGLLAKWETAA